jgi:hypothetical protein
VCLSYCVLNIIITPPGVIWLLLGSREWKFISLLSWPLGCKLWGVERTAILFTVLGRNWGEPSAHCSSSSMNLTVLHFKRGNPDEKLHHWLQKSASINRQEHRYSIDCSVFYSIFGDGPMCHVEFLIPEHDYVPLNVTVSIELTCGISKMLYKSNNTVSSGVLDFNCFVIKFNVLCPYNSIAYIKFNNNLLHRAFRLLIKALKCFGLSWCSSSGSL